MLNRRDCYYVITIKLGSTLPGHHLAAQLPEQLRWDS
jgi:hypothetical protein